MKKDLYELSAELDEVSALLLALSGPLLEGEALLVTVKMGEALSGIENYVERINADLIAITEEQYKANKEATA